MHEQFITKRFSAKSTAVIEEAITIIDDYRAQGFTLTLRQLYYQFVARGLLPNEQREYKRLGQIMSDARMAGLVDWSSIEDRTRSLRSNPHWDGPAGIIESAASSYREDKWAAQDTRIEVWIEKDALTGVIEPVCNELDIPYFACRGYSSQSEQWRAGKRFARYRESGQHVVVLHLGDHDPSGIDMSRDNYDRLDIFSGGSVVLDRLALNMDQIETYSPPPNPTKTTDTRAGNYIARFGKSSWELDALDPPVIDRLIRDAVVQLWDQNAWEASTEKEATNRELLEKARQNWGKVEEFLNAL